jgi:RNA polymerase sigma factor (sigma-70 family)
MAWEQSTGLLSGIGNSAKESPYTRDQPETQPATGIEVLGLSVRPYNCLRRVGIDTVERLAAMSNDDLLAIRNLGINSLTEIHGKLSAYLGSHPLPEQPQPPAPPLPEPPPPLIDPELLSRAARIPLDSIPLTRLALPVLLHNLLRRRGIESVGDLLTRQPADAFCQDYLVVWKRHLNCYLTWLVEQDEATWADEVADRGINPLHLLRLAEVTSVTQYTGDQPETQPATGIEVLGLSVRAYNCLRRVGIDTVERLAAMSDDDLLAIRNLGINSLTEIHGKLSAYLDSHPLPEQSRPPAPSLPEPPPPLIDPELLSRAARILLDSIPLTRLALPVLLHNLLRRRGIESVGDLTRQVSEVSDRDSMVVRQLSRYLTWLVEQDEATWADEVAGRDISPLHRVFLADTTLEALMNEMLATLLERQRRVIRWRYGLDGETLTLQEVGDHLNLTRERVRQLEAKALRILQDPVRRQRILPLKALLYNLLQNAGGIMSETQIEEALRRELTIGVVSPIGVARLIFSLYDDFKSVCGEPIWGCTSFPLDQVPAITRELVEVLEMAHELFPFDEVVARFKATSFYQDHRDGLDDVFIAACLRTHPSIEVDDRGMCGLTKWGKGRVGEIALALRQIGHPAHYSVIAERANVLLPPDQQTSERNIHAYLDRRPDVFVHLGRGKYWFRGHMESEMSAPPQADFGDLFGAQLANWQAELDRHQGGSRLNTHAEVDIIRSVGLDFFRD